jgi:histidinol-phosphate aminotransferase
VGYALGSADLIAGLNRVKYSFNPYNVNRLSIIAGAAAVEDEPYFQNCCASIREDRAWTAAELKKLGFTVLPSKANFLFAKSDRLSGEELYRKLKKEGILVRWWANSGRIEDYVRITVGSMAQMEALVDTLEKLVKEAE